MKNRHGLLGYVYLLSVTLLSGCDGGEASLVQIDPPGSSDSGPGGSSSSSGQAPSYSGPFVPEWPGPEAEGEQEVTETIIVGSEGFDGGMVRYFGSGDLGTGDQDENQPPIFKLHSGAVLENVIIGAPAADGVHCIGSCTIRNVWWEDVGEDAATSLGTTDEDVLLVEGGGARRATDKVFQHNGRGTFHIKDFFVEEFGKVYRSCGNCETQYKRRVIIENLTAVTWDASSAIVGVNENYGDVAEFRGKNEVFDFFETAVCQRYEGNDTGSGPEKTGVGPDGEHCLYDDESVIVYDGL